MMPGIPPKCLDCGTDLRYDVTKLTYQCPVCPPVERPTVGKARESLKEAA
jgi:predicted RNA-binding Zn-ribbon protein involved in translation (DUF1610 family)